MVFSELRKQYIQIKTLPELFHSLFWSYAIQPTQNLELGAMTSRHHVSVKIRSNGGAWSWTMVQSGVYWQGKGGVVKFAPGDPGARGGGCVSPKVTSGIGQSTQP